MTNKQFHDNRNNYLDPAMILAATAAEHAAVIMEHSILDRAPSGAVLVDPEVAEEVIMGLAWGALCKSRGVPESENDEISWSFYCQGVLEGAVLDYELEGLSASYAWPELQLAVMITADPSDYANLADGELGECAYVEIECEAIFRKNSWIVVRVDGDSPMLEAQLERIAAVVRALQVGGIGAA